MRKSPVIVTPIEVVVDSIDPNDTETAILNAALVAARETRSSLWAWNVDWNGGDTAVVKLHRD